MRGLGGTGVLGMGGVVVDDLGLDFLGNHAVFLLSSSAIPNSQVKGRKGRRIGGMTPGHSLRARTSV